MFISLNLTDNVPICISSIDRTKSSLIAFNNKYSNKRTKFGLGICVQKILKIHFYKIIDEHLLVRATFQAIFLKMYNDELCHGVLINQDESGLVIKNIYGYINVKKKFLDKEFEFEKCKQVWVWNYEGKKLYFRNNERIRFKVVVKFKWVFGRIDEQGLGPISWWEPLI